MNMPAFRSDEDVESAIDGLVMTVPGEEFELMLGERELDPNRIQHMNFAKNLLEYLTNGTGAQVFCDTTPVHNVGLVSVKGPSVVFRNPEWLLKLCELSSRLEAYPAAGEGGIMVDFLFPGITKPAEPEVFETIPMRYAQEDNGNAKAGEEEKSR